MTPEAPKGRNLSATERAKKICKNWRYIDEQPTRSFCKAQIAAELEAYAPAAVEEAEGATRIRERDEWSKIMLSAVKEAKAEAFAEGKRAAYEDAAKILEGMKCRCSCAANERLQQGIDAIRARAQDMLDPSLRDEEVK